jgi:hypothetical protein
MAIIAADVDEIWKLTASNAERSWAASAASTTASPGAPPVQPPQGGKALGEAASLAEDRVYLPSLARLRHADWL